jgi:tRNA pseudouridine55 synthase
MPEGFLVLDKPEGISSMGAVAAVKRRFRPLRVKAGHGGTLDPLATGVLVVGVGRATRRLAEVVEAAKTYRTAIDLSAFTTTDDREGPRAEVAPATLPDGAAVRRALATFEGEIEQTPSAYSAVKIGGRRAYRLARAGEAPTMPPRLVRIDRIELLAYEWPLATVEVHCGKGTYIRSIARALGERLGTGGHCAWLARTRVGGFSIEDARPLDALPESLSAADLLPLAEPPTAAAPPADGA